jgi:RNA polymerase sigma factor (sigma-70 family)
MDRRADLIPDDAGPSSEHIVETLLRPSGQENRKTTETLVSDHATEIVLQSPLDALNGDPQEKEEIEDWFYEMLKPGQESESAKRKMNDATDRLGAVVFRIVCSKLRHSDVYWLSARDDIFQNVMFKLIRYGQSFDPKKSTLGAWIAAIANNETREYKKRARIMTTIMHDVPDDYTSATSEDDEDDDSFSRLAQVIRSANLSEIDMEILTWPEGYNIKDLAKKLGRSPGALRVRKSRLLKRLRELLRRDKPYSGQAEPID